MPGPFQPSDATAELRGRVRRFVDDHVIPAEPALSRWDADADALMRDLQGRAKDEGLWALGHPAHLGGGGLAFMDYVYVNEVVGRSDFAMPALGTHSLQDSLMLDAFGTAAQKSRYLEPIIAGEHYPCIAMTEPEVAGSDPTLARTTARLDGDEWVLDGHKWFSTWANKADVVTVFALTDPGASTYQRFSMILVPTDTPGFELVRVIPTMGHPSNHCEIRLTDVRVPAENLLGERGAAFTIAQQRLGPGRIYHCMRWLGQAQRAFELMCDRANQREAHGSLLSKKGEIQRYVAESAAQIQAARLLTLDAAHAIDSGDQARVQISLIKFLGAQMLHDVIDRSIQVHGALGVTGDTPLEAMYRHARYARIYDGPDEVHRMVVARAALKDVSSMPWA